MRKLVAAALAASSLLALAPSAWASPDLPPTDAARVEGGWSSCPPDYPCTPVFEPYRVYVDKTYPSRLVLWVEEHLP